jgi:assimilatory nitrate reductase catalytic subunit
MWHTLTRPGRVPILRTLIAAPCIALHARDAAARGIADRGLARVENEHGSIVIRATLDEGVRPGDVFGAMHWTDQFSSSGPIDRLVHAVTDPVSGQPDLKGTKVRVTAVAEAWRGSLLRRDGETPALSDALWWAKATLEEGYAFEMAGWNPLAQEIRSEATLRRLLGIAPEVELVSYSDPRKSMFRYAGIAHGELQACVFFGPPGEDFAGIEQAKALLGKPISPMERIALLAGLESKGRQTGRTICACFGVEENRIKSAIAEGCSTAAEIGAACKAGTNCGSCIPELKKLLRATRAAALDAAE